MTKLAALIALSALGSMVKIQGSIAFDSMPGYFAALYLGPGPGAVVGGLGHLLTAMTSGFPLTIPMHLVVALQMALFTYFFGWIYVRSNWVLASMATILLNGPIADLMVVPISQLLKLPFSGWPLFHAILLPLTLASSLNVFLAHGLFRALERRLSL